MDEKNTNDNQPTRENENTGSQQNSDGRAQGEKKFQRKNYYNRRRRYPQNRQNQPHVVREKTSFKKLSIVIPLLDEQESLNPLVIEIKKALRQVEIGWEVLFVDDGSTDNSLQIIKEITRIDRRFRYFSFKKNYGKSAALNVGFKNVTGDVVITMDADLQDDPNEIPSLLKKLDEGFDVVSGWKKKRQDPFIKKFSSKFFNFVTGILSGLKLHDFNCGLKAYRREATENIKVYGELHRYMPVLADWSGFSVSEIVVKHHPRRYGKTKFGVSRFFKGFIDLITVMFTTRYIKRPMHLFGFLGALSFLAGLAINAYLTYEWILGNQLSNRPMLFLGMLLIIVGMQFFSVGLLGEIIVHNFMDDKEYVIKDKG